MVFDILGYNDALALVRGVIVALVLVSALSLAAILFFVKWKPWPAFISGLVVMSACSLFLFLYAVPQTVTAEQGLGAQIAQAGEFDSIKFLDGDSLASAIADAKAAEGGSSVKELTVFKGDEEARVQVSFAVSDGEMKVQLLGEDGELEPFTAENALAGLSLVVQ